MTGKKTPDTSPKGLGAKRRAAVAPRPARPSARACQPVKTGTSQDYEPVSITRHRDLAGRQREIFRRLNNEPHIATLMAINPVLALKELGITFNAQMRDHVLRALQHSPRLSSRRRELEASLTEALGEAPQPHNASWLADVVFCKLEVQPKVTRGRTPTYRAPVTQPMLDRLSRRRPAATYKKPPARRRASSILLKPWQPAIRRLDLDAPVPELAAAKTAPKTLSLPSLWFYRDDHPLLRPLLELGVIAEQSFPIHTGAAYRAIREGKKANAFRAWIREIRFKTE